MAKINTRTQTILEDMIVDKFGEKRKALTEELDAIKKRNQEIADENKDKCKDYICQYIENANELIQKVLKAAGLEINRRYCGNHALCLFDNDGLHESWKEFIRPIAKKSTKQEALEQELDKLTTKCKKAIDELVLRASLGCKYDDVMEFINNLEV